MAITSAIAGVVKGIADPFSKAYQKNQDRKQARETGEAKIAQSKVEGNKEITLTDQEWEAISKKSESDSWKDEYVTIVITLPLILIFVGSLFGGFTGDYTILDETVKAIGKLSETGVDMGALMTAVVYAAVGIKAVKSTLLR